MKIMRVFEKKKFKKTEVDVLGPIFGSHQAGQEHYVFESKRVYDNFIQNCKILIKNVTHLRKKRAILPEKSIVLAR